MVGFSWKFFLQLRSIAFLGFFQSNLTVSLKLNKSNEVMTIKSLLELFYLLEARYLKDA